MSSDRDENANLSSGDLQPPFQAEESGTTAGPAYFSMMENTAEQFGAEPVQVTKLLKHCLSDIAAAERQLVDALPRIIEMVGDRYMKSALTSHLEETRKHCSRAEHACQLLSVEEHSVCPVMTSLLREGENILDMAGAQTKSADLAVALLVSQIEHYEVATYRAARDLAIAAAHTEIATLLDETLREEVAAVRQIGMALGDTLEITSRSSEDRLRFG